MTRIHPFGPPNYVPYATAVGYLETAGFSQQDANIGAAVAMASSTIDTRLIDDSPAVAQYNVGAWQVNYYGPGYEYLAVNFGTPHQLVDAGIAAQAHLTRVLFLANGWIFWPAYVSGAYRQFLTGTGPSIAQRNVSVASPPPPSDTGNDSWSGKVVGSGDVVGSVAYLSYVYANLIKGLIR